MLCPMHFRDAEFGLQAALADSSSDAAEFYTAIRTLWLSFHFWLHGAGLELFFVDAAGPGTPGRTPSVFFAFRSELDRDRAARAIAQQPTLGTSLPGGREVASACGSILQVGSV